MPACTAPSRAGRSGCPRPGSWSAKRGSTPTKSMLPTVPGVFSRPGPPRPSRSRRLRSRVAMSPLNSHTLRWRGGWARIGPFRSDADVARLTMGTDAPPSPSVIERCLGEVQARSYKAVVTNALGPAESAPFVDAGFAVRERLHLLAHDLDVLPPATGSTRRARHHAARQHRRALAVRIVRLPAPPHRAVRARADALRRATVVVLAAVILFALAALPDGAGVDPQPTTANA